MKQHHHVRVDRELKLDCLVWLEFLHQPQVICRPFVDFSDENSMIELAFFTDAVKSDRLGMGGVFNKQWFSQSWDEFIKDYDPSIEYLELLALNVGIDLWCSFFQDKRVILFCDNEAVVHMVNKSASGCKNCMVLIWLIVINSMKWNCRLFICHVKGVSNIKASLLSGMKISKFQVE